MAYSILKRTVLPPPTLTFLKPKTLFFFFSTQSPPSDLISTVVTLLVHHRSRTRWSQLRSVLASSSRQLTPPQFSQIALHLKQKPHLALRLFHFTLSHPSLFAHDLSSLATLAHLLARGRLRSHACDVIRTALRCPDSFNYEDPVTGLFEVLVKSYRECDSAPFVFDLLIKTCLEVRKVDGSLEVVRKLRSRGISPQVGTCNCLVSWVVKCRGCREGYRVFKEVFGLGEDGEELEGVEVKRVFRVRPNVHSFNALMEGIYRHGEVGLVEEVWRKMRRFSCVPNGFSYSVLIAVLCEEGRMEEVEKLWGEMWVEGVEPDVVGYNTVIGAYCGAGKVDKAEEVFREMGLKGVEGTCVTFGSLVEGHCRVGNVDSGLLIYKDMRRQGFRPEGSIVSILIEALCEKARVVDAMKIMKVATKDHGFCLSRKSYGILINGLCNEGKMDEALKLQAEMVGKGHKPDPEIYEAFLKGYAKMGNEKMVTLLKKEMAETQMQQEEI